MDTKNCLPVAAIAEATASGHYIAEQVRCAAEAVSVLNERPDGAEQKAFYETVKRTSLEQFDGLLPDDLVLEKNETVQPGGSYKIRGALRNIQLQLATRPYITEFHAASTGNHGAALPIAAGLYSRTAVIHAPVGITATKQHNVTIHGGELVADYADFAAAKQACEAFADLPGVAVIEPYDDVRTMAGQATAGYEIVADLMKADQNGDVDLKNDTITVWLPGGGGGFAVGCAVALTDAKERGLVPASVVLKVAQMAGSDAIYRLQKHEPPLSRHTLDTSCDATAVLRPGKLTAAVLQDKRFVADVIRVPKHMVAEAMYLLEQRHGMAVEPAAALTLAAVLAQTGTRHKDGRSRQVHVTVTSGANVGPSTTAHFANVRSAHRFAALSRAYLERPLDGPDEIIKKLGTASIRQSSQVWTGPATPWRK